MTVSQYQQERSAKMSIYSNGDAKQISPRRAPSCYENVSSLRMSSHSREDDNTNLYANIDSLPLPPPPRQIMSHVDGLSGEVRFHDSNDFPPPPPPNSVEPVSYMHNVGRMLAGYKPPEQQTSCIYANTIEGDCLAVNNVYSNQANLGTFEENIYQQLYEQIDRLNLAPNNNNNNNNNKFISTTPTVSLVSSDRQPKQYSPNYHQSETSTTTVNKSKHDKNNNKSNNSTNIYANSPPANLNNNNSVNRLKSNRLPIKNCSSLLYLGSSSHKGKEEDEVDHLTDLLVKSMENANEPDFFGMCHKCGEKVVGEGSGCTAMEMVYHIQCFTCFECHKELRGKSFYAMESNPFCEDCYLNTLEKCCVCSKPILERILRATGKPYHPNCFTCVVCRKCLDGIPFTVDANNQIHCIDDFHKKFAPRCSVCKEPIVPETGKTETVRVVALDRSFHVACYKCEDCDLLLSSEAEGRGCYPLDDHILCRNCNTKRVQALTA